MLLFLNSATQSEVWLCFFSVCLGHCCFFPVLFFYLPCRVLMSEIPCRWLACWQGQTPSYLPFHAPREKGYSFFPLRTCAMPSSSSSHLSPRPGYFHQIWFFCLQLMLEQHPNGLPLKPNPLGFWGETALLLCSRFGWEKPPFWPFISICHFRTQWFHVLSSLHSLGSPLPLATSWQAPSLLLLFEFIVMILFLFLSLL